MMMLCDHARVYPSTFEPISNPSHPPVTQHPYLGWRVAKVRVRVASLMAGVDPC